MCGDTKRYGVTMGDDIGAAPSLATPATETWPTDPKAPVPGYDGETEAAAMGMQPIAGRETGAAVSESSRDTYIAEMHKMVDTAMRTEGMAAVVITVKPAPGGGLAWGWSGNLPRHMLTNWLVERSMQELFASANVLEIDGTAN